MTEEYIDPMYQTIIEILEGFGYDVKTVPQEKTVDSEVTLILYDMDIRNTSFVNFETTTILSLEWSCEDGPRIPIDIKWMVLNLDEAVRESDSCASGGFNIIHVEAKQVGTGSLYKIKIRMIYKEEI